MSSSNSSLQDLQTIISSSKTSVSLDLPPRSQPGTRELLRRHPANPIIEPQNMPFECSAIYNAGAVRVGDKVCLLVRVENFERETSFHLAESSDGVQFTVNPTPVEYPLRPVEKHYGSHRFDMRITPIDGEYIICHALMLRGLGCMIAMARTSDLRNFEAVPGISAPFNRNAVLFPKKIKGQYARLERPQDISGRGRIWISYSSDLTYWGNHTPIDLPVPSWSEGKSGAGCIPIFTPAGWLIIYHATCHTASTENYYISVALLDLDDPSKVVAAPRKFILGPEEDYECVGQVPNVVFTGGAVEMDDGTLNIYYGGADTRLCLAQTTVSSLVDFCLTEHGNGRVHSMW